MTKNMTRRRFVARAFDLMAASTALVALAPRTALACLGGTWYVYCENQYNNGVCGQVDQVTAGTCQHICSRCGQQVFRGSDVTVVCPNNHRWSISTGRTTSYI